MTPQLDSLSSSFREKLLDHVFVAELLQEAWLGESHTEPRTMMEVLRPEVDNSGYDVVLSLGKVTRYVQIKSSRADAKTSRQTINSNLADKPGACVIWLSFQKCNKRIKLEYRVFPEKICGKLDLSGFKVGRHTKANRMGLKSERENIRVIPNRCFTNKQSTKDLVSWLFG